MNWRERALCRDRDTELFFPDTDYGRRYALEHCEFCPVKVECLEFAMDSERDAHRDDRAGIYGGTTPNRRYEMHLDRQGKNRGRRGGSKLMWCRSGRHRMEGSNVLTASSDARRCRSCKLEANARDAEKRRQKRMLSHE